LCLVEIFGKNRISILKSFGGKSGEVKNKGINVGVFRKFYGGEFFICSDASKG
jgi:hypothetical protein